MIGTIIIWLSIAFLAAGLLVMFIVLMQQQDEIDKLKYAGIVRRENEPAR